MNTTALAADHAIEVEVRLFNISARPGRGENPIQSLVLPNGGTVWDVLKTLQIPLRAIFAAWCNGQCITRPLFHQTGKDIVLSDGDIIALSGYPASCATYPFI